MALVTESPGIGSLFERRSPAERVEGTVEPEVPFITGKTQTELLFEDHSKVICAQTAFSRRFWY